MLGFAGSSAAAGPARVPRAASTGAGVALLNRAFADARAKGSFHQSLNQVIGSVHGSLQDDVTASSGRQTIVSSDGTRAAVDVIGQTAYLSGNTRALRSYFKFTASQVGVIGSNWVEISATNSTFAAIAYDVTIPTALAEVAPSGHLTVGAKTTVDGEQVIPISGGVPSPFAGGTNGRATIYVTASADPLPVRASVRVTQSNHSKLTLSGTMGAWGEHVAVKAPVGQALTADQIARLVHRLSGLGIPDAPGYFAVTGQQGQPVPLGRPWGSACKPVRFAIDRSVPAPVRSEIGAVVSAARRQGIDVTVAGSGPGGSGGSLYYRGGQTPSTVASVRILAAGPTPSTKSQSSPIQLTASSALDADRQNDDLRSVTAALSLTAVHGKRQTLSRAIRQLIAWTQGISQTTDPVSGISSRSFTDRFTRADVAAMLDMSGCAKAPSTVIGIAA